MTAIVPELGPVSVPVPPGGVDSAAYDVTGDPPSDAGAVTATVAVVAPVAVAIPMVGASGAVWTVDAETRGVEASLGPVPLDATTSTTTELPGSRLPIVQDVAPVVVQIPRSVVPSDAAQAVAVYPPMELPPS